MAAMLLWVACSTIDLSFINEVKRFEPRWMSLGEKVAFVNRNLNAAGRRYQQGLKEVEPAFSNTGPESRTQVYSLRGEYRTVIDGRDGIQARFDEEKSRFTDVVNRFNAWQSKVMKNQLNQSQAQADFDQFMKEYESITESLEKKLEETGGWA